MTMHSGAGGPPPGLPGRRPSGPGSDDTDRGSITPLVIGMFVCLLILTAGVAAAGSAFLAGQRLQRLCDGAVAENGAVGLLIGGEGVLGTVVSQGCRPIGPAMTVTAAHDNVVEELAGESAYTRLEAVLETLSDEDRDLAEHGLQLGIAMDEYADHHEQGDFLIRSLTGADAGAGT